MLSFTFKFGDLNHVTHRNSSTKHAYPSAFPPPQILTRLEGAEGGSPDRDPFLSAPPFCPMLIYPQLCPQPPGWNKDRGLGQLSLRVGTEAGWSGQMEPSVLPSLGNLSLALCPQGQLTALWLTAGVGWLGWLGCGLGWENVGCYMSPEAAPQPQGELQSHPIPTEHCGTMQGPEATVPSAAAVCLGVLQGVWGLGRPGAGAQGLQGMEGLGRGATGGLSPTPSSPLHVTLALVACPLPQSAPEAVSQLTAVCSRGQGPNQEERLLGT